MNEGEVVITEHCGSLGKVSQYRKGSDGQSSITRLSQDATYTNSAVELAKEILRDVFLPHGYPESVSEDYFNYQIWDTVQAFCSTITGTFTTRAVLQGVGVGNAEATPLAAAITWITKDGTGMLGRILFAWWKGNRLDGDCKKWRLFADFLNDTAMFLELTVPFFSNMSLQVLCVTTAMKAVVGVAGSATRASITQHQAIKGNMADVSAKDGSQETCVNLIASLIGIFLLAVFSEGQYEWYIFFVLTSIHLLANYLAVKSLMFSHLNNSRLAIVLKTYLRFDALPNPSKVNEKESVVLGWGLKFTDVCNYDIKVGECLKQVLLLQTPEHLHQLLEIYGDKNYLIIPDLSKRRIHVALHKGETAEDIISAYYEAVLLALTLCVYNGINPAAYTKRQLHQHTPLIRLNSWMRSYSKNSPTEEVLPRNVLKDFSEFAGQEIGMFLTALKINSWDVGTHALSVGKWRYEWKVKKVVFANIDLSTKKQE